MRDVRQVHEVLCPHAAVVSSSSSTNRVDGFTDVWESSLGAFAPNSLSPEAALYLSNNQTNLSKIAPGIVRFLTGSGLRLSASGIRLSEDIILTNEHVVQSMLSGGAPWMITNQPRSRFDSMRTNSKQHCLFTQLVLRPQIPLEQPMMDPIIGVGVFNYEDAATVRLNIVPGTTLANSRVIFIPSMRTVDPATNIISISYPGNEAATTNAELSFGPDLNHQQDLATYREMLPAFQDLRARFNGFGVSTVAYGKCIKPFKLHEGFWIENIAFQSTIDTDSIIVSNENSLCGGSGGAILRHDFQISSLNDTKGDVWTMVEFNGLHFGGEFIPCQECLSLDPSARVTLEPSQIQQLLIAKLVLRSKRAPDLLQIESRQHTTVPSRSIRSSSSKHF
eukprot:TRINITY_DN3783_c0_g1_i5.p1 TRINITY_DN3783_c0_g1~~TRINITY_DN3783_c0_g1_i5.p1  ORF type:complete len:392 (-),score=77.18 TRINITY_DN3783_c0_g1_i5:641-1816(-)